jgi:hypothetical protein
MINTLKISKQLEAATLPKAQADAIAEALADATAPELASKSDIITLRGELKNDIKELELRMIKEISRFRAQLNGRINVILWVLFALTGLTWILQVFAITLKHLLGIP